MRLDDFNCHFMGPTVFCKKFQFSCTGSFLSLVRMNVLHLPSGPVTPWVWEQDIYGYSIPVWAIYIGCAVAMPILKSILHRTISEPLGRAFLKPPSDPHGDGKKKAALQMLKWNESCWEFICYAGFSVLAYKVGSQERWFYDSRYLWMGCYRLPCDFELSTPHLALYLLELAWYLHSAVSLIFHKGPKKKDHVQMVAHHLVTLILVSYSLAMNFTRVGCVVFLLHDVCDVFLQFAKLLKYSKIELGATIAFIAFLCVWIVARLIYFPVYILRSVVYDTYAIIIAPHDVNPDPHINIFTVALFFLFGIHIFWTYLILKVAYRSVVTRSTDDVREDEDSD